DDLDRVSSNDVRVVAELYPQPAFCGKPAFSDPAPQQFPAQRLECNHLRARTIHMVVDHIDEAHPAFVDIEDLEPSTNPLSHGKNVHHAGCLRPLAQSVNYAAIVPSSRTIMNGQFA